MKDEVQGIEGEELAVMQTMKTLVDYPPTYLR
jgi:hypothetical protein